MRIRTLHPDEMEFLADMLYEAIFVPEGHDPLPKEIIKDKALSKYIENWGKDKYDIALVAEVDQQPIGAIWGRLFPEEDKGFGFVDGNTPELSMALAPTFRGKGIGSQLIPAIITAYKNIEVACVSLSVDKANRAAHLYKRHGFTIVEETETSWTMKKEIR